MEEKIKKMEVKEGESKKENPSKLSYEQLSNVASQLNQQNQQLMMRLRSVDNMFKRLDYLFKVVENAVEFKEEFVTKCTEEIEDMMTLQEDTEETKEDKE